MPGGAESGVTRPWKGEGGPYQPIFTHITPWLSLVSQSQRRGESTKFAYICPHSSQSSLATRVLRNKYIVEGLLIITNIAISIVCIISHHSQKGGVCNPVKILVLPIQYIHMTRETTSTSALSYYCAIKTEILCHFNVAFYEAKLYNKKNWANLSVKAVMVV